MAGRPVLSGAVQDRAMLVGYACTSVNPVGAGGGSSMSLTRITTVAVLVPPLPSSAVTLTTNSSWVS